MSHVLILRLTSKRRWRHNRRCMRSWELIERQRTWVQSVTVKPWFQLIFITTTTELARFHVMGVFLPESWVQERSRKAIPLTPEPEDKLEPRNSRKSFLSRAHEWLCSNLAPVRLKISPNFPSSSKWKISFRVKKLTRADKRGTGGGVTFSGRRRVKHESQRSKQLAGSACENGEWIVINRTNKNRQIRV